jgi:hypothetical protein
MTKTQSISALVLVTIVSLLAISSLVFAQTEEGVVINDEMTAVTTSAEMTPEGDVMMAEGEAVMTSEETMMTEEDGLVADEGAMMAEENGMMDDEEKSGKSWIWVLVAVVVIIGGSLVMKGGNKEE